MTVTLEDPAAVLEIEKLMERFEMSAAQVVERVIVEAGAWMPLGILKYPILEQPEVSSDLL